MWVILTIFFCSQVEVAFSHGELSRQKCEEYAKAVFVSSSIQTLNGGSNLVSECGIVEVPLATGGSAAPEKEFPHMATIGFGNSPNSELVWACGGSLISDRYVLTAAHCLNNPEEGPAQKVKFGVIFIDSKENLQEIIISARIPHPGHKPPSKYNDIALIKLVAPVIFTPFVRPACININGNFQNKEAIAIGFGKLAYDATAGSKRLMKVRLPLIPNGQCELAYSKGPERIPLARGVHESMLCAGDMKGGKDTCQGDSGGPLQLVLSSPYCMYTIIGVTSFGKFCGFPNSPAIYTRVAYYVDWIENTVWK